MGIDRYLTDLLTRFPNITVPRVYKPDILVIDINTVLHRACHASRNRNQFDTYLTSFLSKLVSKLQPKRLAIFTDGQAVRAKAKSQLKRRNDKMYAKPKPTINTLNLTPGTPFMDGVDTLLQQFCDNLCGEQGVRRGQHAPFYYSSSQIPNEGEIKMFEWLKQIPGVGDQRICIYGNDADIVVLSLFNSPLLHVSISHDKQFISLFKLIRELAKVSNYHCDYKYHPVRQDLGLVSILSGNDYLPGLFSFKRGLEQYLALLAAQSRLLPKKQGFLVNRDLSLNIPNVKKLLGGIVQHQPPNHQPPSSRKQVYQYFQAVVWNIKLYNGDPIHDYLPNNQSINLASAAKYIPDRVTLPESPREWLDMDVNLLMLMPSVGRDYLPARLRRFTEPGSPISDLFPDPCRECIHFKSEISLLKSRQQLLEPVEYKCLANLINISYRDHLNACHPAGELPIERISQAIKSTQ